MSAVGNLPNTLDVAQEETTFVLMDAITHLPEDPQQPMPSDGSFIGALRAKPQFPNVHCPTTTDERKCYYCGEGSHFIERCPKRLKDFLRRRTARRTSSGPAGRGARPPMATPARPNTLASAKKGPLQPGRSTNTNSSGARRIATLQEEDGHDDVPAVADSQDPLDEYDFACLDEATVAALYEEFKDTSPADPEDNEAEDFLQGQ